MTGAASRSPPAAPERRRGPLRLDSGVAAAAEIEESDDGRFAKTAAALVVFAVLMAVLWAALTPVHELTSGTGTIRPTEQAERIDHLEGGIVAAVHTDFGALVEPGGLIVTLDDQSVRAEIAKLAAEEAALVVELGRTNAALATVSADGLVRVGDARQGDGPEGRAEAPAAAGAVNDAAEAPTGQFDGVPGGAAWRADLAYRQAQVAVLRAERRVRMAELSALEIRRKNVAEERALIGRQLARYDALGPSSAIPLRQFEALERDRIQLDRTALGLDGEAERQAAELSRLDSRVAELEAGYRREAALRLADLEARLTAAQEAIATLSDRLRRTEIRSRRGGRVQDLTVTNAGQVVPAGGRVAELVPLGQRVFAEIEISADAIGGVQVGMPASLKILTHDFTRFGDIEAEVTDISPSSYLNEAGAPVFRVRLRFDTAEDPAADNLEPWAEGSPVAKPPMIGGRAITPGMTVAADIRSGSKTVLSYLLKPVRLLSDQAFSEG